MLPTKIRPLLPYAIVVFLGYVGFSLPLPVLPEMFLDSKRSILPATMSIQLKTVLLGIVLAAYPSGQFKGCF
jgi:predicted tellurium resistance membrane protein TerC